MTIPKFILYTAGAPSLDSGTFRGGAPQLCPGARYVDGSSLISSVCVDILFKKVPVAWSKKRNSKIVSLHERTAHVCHLHYDAILPGITVLKDRRKF